jgi:hypothetical protein
MGRFYFFFVEDTREAFAAGIRAKHIRPLDNPRSELSSYPSFTTTTFLTP